MEVLLDWCLKIIQTSLMVTAKGFVCDTNPQLRAKQLKSPYAQLWRRIKVTSRFCCDVNIMMRLRRSLQKKKKRFQAGAKEVFCLFYEQNNRLELPTEIQIVITYCNLISLLFKGWKWQNILQKKTDSHQWATEPESSPLDRDGTARVHL